MIQAQRYIDMLSQIMDRGTEIYPRGTQCREIEDLQLRVDPNFPFMTFAARKYDVSYFKKEMRWKLGASKYDESIKEVAKMWDKVQNPDGTFNSNYGQYWFGEQHGIWDVVMELIRDEDSRKAVIPMLNVSHMSPQTVDTVCTECVGFRIRDGKLNMSVHMRSSDVIFGLGTDVPTFSFLYRLVLGLVESQYNRLLTGEIIITAMSSHIYDRHYFMVDQILMDGDEFYTSEYMPYCDFSEAMAIIASRGRLDLLPSTGELGRWLCG